MTHSGTSHVAEQCAPEYFVDIIHDCWAASLLFLHPIAFPSFCEVYLSPCAFYWVVGTSSQVGTLRKRLYNLMAFEQRVHFVRFHYSHTSSVFIYFSSCLFFFLTTQCYFQHNEKISGLLVNAVVVTNMLRPHRLVLQHELYRAV